MPSSEIRRILIIGSGGAGKSMLAQRLSKILELPLINLDAYYWKPGWVETGKQEWEQIVSGLIKGDSWVIDGNYGGTLSARLKAADTIIFLDYSRSLCLYRGLRRQLTRVRPDIIPGCHEKMDVEFMQWIWNYPRKTRPRIMKILEEEGKGKRILIFNNPSETRKFVERLENVSRPKK